MHSFYMNDKFETIQLKYFMNKILLCRKKDEKVKVKR